MRHRHTSEQGSPGLQARSEETSFDARVAERDVEVRGEINLPTGEALWRAIEGPRPVAGGSSPLRASTRYPEHP